MELEQKLKPLEYFKTTRLIRAKYMMRKMSDIDNNVAIIAGEK